MTSLAYLHDCHCCYNERSNVQKKKVKFLLYFGHSLSWMAQVYNDKVKARGL